MTDPRIWGGDQWATMHRISLVFPRSPTRKQRKAARDYFESLCYLMPCTGCREHYCKHFKETFTDKTTESRRALARWVYDLHESVNKRLGKALKQVEFEDLPSLYLKFPDRYIAADGKSLLEKPRYDPLRSNLGGAVKKSELVEEAIRVPSNMLSSSNGSVAASSSATDSTFGSAFSMGTIILVCVAILSFVCAVVAIVIAVRSRKALLESSGSSSGSR